MKKLTMIVIMLVAFSTSMGNGLAPGQNLSTVGGEPLTQGLDIDRVLMKKSNNPASNVPGNGIYWGVGYFGLVGNQPSGLQINTNGPNGPAQMAIVR